MYTYVPCPSCGKLNRTAWEESGTKAPICGACKTALPVHFGVADVGGNGLKTLTAKSPIPVVCDFWAPWCGPCKGFAPVFQQAARQLAGRVTFAKLNTEQFASASDAYGIRSIPTLILFQGGREKSRVSGALPLEDFVGWLESQLT